VNAARNGHYAGADVMESRERPNGRVQPLPEAKMMATPEYSLVSRGQEGEGPWAPVSVPVGGTRSNPLLAGGLAPTRAQYQDVS
jgi:hypothetical protein